MIDLRDDDVSERADADATADPYGLTGRQREVLTAAIEAGFFAVPRETTLTDLADELGISNQAISEHLRCAQWNLLQATVLAGPSDFPPRVERARLLVRPGPIPRGA